MKPHLCLFQLFYSTLNEANEIEQLKENLLNFVFWMRVIQNNNINEKIYYVINKM